MFLYLESADNTARRQVAGSCYWNLSLTEKGEKTGFFEAGKQLSKALNHTHPRFGTLAADGSSLLG